MVTLQQILFDYLVVLFFVAGLGAAAVGVGLVVCSGRMFRLFAVMNRYVSTRKRMKSMSMSHDIGHLVRRYSGWLATAIVAGAIYSLFSLLTNFDTATIAAGVVPAANTVIPHALVIAVVEGLRWFMVSMSAVALVVGGMLGFFPGALHAVEARANRWYSLRRVSVGLDTVHLTLDRWVEAFPRAAGLAITLGALILIVSSGVTLFK